MAELGMDATDIELEQRVRHKVITQSLDARCYSDISDEIFWLFLHLFNKVSNKYFDASVPTAH